MTQSLRSQSVVFFLLLAAVVFAMPGCEKAEDPVSPDGNPTTGWIEITEGAEGQSEWLLVKPDGTETRGEGDSMLVNPEVGDYWLLWEPVEGWNSPLANPATITYDGASLQQFQASYRKIQGDKGDISVLPHPDDNSVTWNLHGPDGFFAAGRGSKLLRNRAVGAYLVIWSPVEGYETPPQATGTLARGETLLLEATYEESAGPVGEIVVDVSPDGVGASWMIESLDGGQWSGTGDDFLAAMPAGDYTVTFGEVDGYQTPAVAAFSVGDGERVLVEASWTELSTPTGTFIVDAEPDQIQAPWVLESASGLRREGRGDAVVEQLATEMWELRWGPVNGYRTPGSVNVVLSGGMTVQWTATYVPETAPVGTVVVETAGMEAPWYLESLDGYSLNGLGSQTIPDVPVGDYTLTWGSLAGYITPAAEQATVTEGGTVEFAAAYEPEPVPVGLVRIDPNPDALSAPWELAFEMGTVYSGEGDSVLVDMPLGDYTLTWGAVEGYEPPSPNPVTLTLTAGGAAVFALQ